MKIPLYIFAILIALLSAPTLAYASCLRPGPPPAKYDYVRKSTPKIIRVSRWLLDMKRLHNNQCAVAWPESNSIWMLETIEPGSITWKIHMRHEQAHLDMDSGAEGWRH